MKWLVIIVILLIVVGVLWLRTTRSGAQEQPPGHPHGVDDAAAPPDVPGTGAASESAGEASFFEGTHAPAASPEPGSDFAREPGITDDETTESGPESNGGGARPTT